MNQESCAHESETAQAARSGIWSDAVKTHAGECRTCGAIMVTAMILRAAADEAEETAPTIDYRKLWLTAEFQRRQERLRRLDLVTTFGTSVSIVLVLGTLFFWLRNHFDSITFSFDLQTIGAYLPFVLIAGGALLAILWGSPLGRGATRK